MRNLANFIFAGLGLTMLTVGCSAGLPRVEAFPRISGMSGLAATNNTLTSVREVKPDVVYTLVNIGAVFIDVRTADELRSSFANPDNVVSLSYDRRDESNFVDGVAQLTRGDYQKFVVLICRLGVKSKFAGKTLIRAGFINVFSVIGGLEGPQGWLASNMPLQNQ